MVLVLCTYSDNALSFCTKFNETISYGFKIMRSYRRMLDVSYRDHFAGGEVGREIQAAIGECDELLLALVERGDRGDLKVF